MALDTEEEQVEKIQNIWRSYKYLIITGTVVFLGVYFAYGIYLDKKIKQTEQARFSEQRSWWKIRIVHTRRS
jgi:predicted negative regulator of RcsB-dependent stress response